MEENAVVMDAPVDAGTELDAADLLAGEQEQEAVEQTGVDAPTEQPEDNRVKAIGLEKERIRNQERQRYEQELQQHRPAINVGMRILSDLMNARGITMDEAARIAETNYLRAVAAREGVSENVARAMFMQQQQQGQQQQQQQQQQQGQVDVVSRAGQIKADIANMQMPDGFDFNTAVQDEQFAQMLLEMPTEIAVRLYHAERRATSAPQEIADKLRARQAIPQPGKPRQAGTPKVDYMGMTSDEFVAFKNRKNQAEMNGAKIRL